jgi:hypothetical protein
MFGLYLTLTVVFVAFRAYAIIPRRNGAFNHNKRKKPNCSIAAFLGSGNFTLFPSKPSLQFLLNQVGTRAK